MAEISSIKRKYGGSIETALEHLARSEDRLRQIEHSGEREAEIQTGAGPRAGRVSREALSGCIGSACGRRGNSSTQLSRASVEVAMENAKFQIQIYCGLRQRAAISRQRGSQFALLHRLRGIDQVDFYFSANVGEER